MLDKSCVNEGTIIHWISAAMIVLKFWRPAISESFKLHKCFESLDWSILGLGYIKQVFSEKYYFYVLLAFEKRVAMLDDRWNICVLEKLRIYVYRVYILFAMTNSL